MVGSSHRESSTLIRLSWGGIASVFSLRVSWEEGRAGLAMCATNHSSTPLTGLVVEAVDLQGSGVVVARLSKLGPRGEWSASVRKALVERAVLLRIRCKQGVGDVAYLHR